MHGDKLYYIQLSFPKFHIDALVDTGAFSSALPLKSFKVIQKEAPEYISTSCKSFPKFVKLANGENVSVLYNIEIKFYIAGTCFTEQFLVLKELNSPLLGMPFFKKNDIILHPHKGLLYLPDITLSLNNVSSSKPIKRNIVLSTISKITVLPNQQAAIECKLEKLHPSLQNVIGIIEPSLLFERKTGLCVLSSISRIDSTFRTKIGIINLMPYKITVSPQTRIGKFQLVTQNQASYLLPMHPSIIDCYKELNTVIETKQTSEMDNYASKNFWFGTPEYCGDPTTLNGIQKTIYDTIKRFKQLELLDPTIKQENKKQFLQKFNWSGSIFTKLERQKM